MDFGNHSPGILKGDYSFFLLKLLLYLVVFFVFFFFLPSRTLAWDQNITQTNIVPDISESKDFDYEVFSFTSSEYYTWKTSN